MNCSECGTELHYRARRCWKCGTAVANHTRTLYEEEEPLRPEQLWGSPEALPRAQQKLIRVYKKRWFGMRLAGWVDENKQTYKANWPYKPIWRPHLSITKSGEIYIQGGESRAYIGWVEEDGDVYAQYGSPTSGFFSYPESLSFIQPAVGFAPSLVFQVSADGTIYRRNRRGSKIIGKVVGTPGLQDIAGLALVVLT